MIKSFNKLLNPLRRKTRQLITRGLVTLVDPTTLMQSLQVELLSGEVLDNIEHFEGYGLTAHAPDDSEVLAASLNGQRSHTIAIAVANRIFRLKGLAKGEVALYTDEGDVIHFKRGNHIYIDAMTKVTAKAPNVDIIASTKVTMTTPECEITGKLTVGQTIEAGGKIDSATGVSTGGIELGTHVHPGDSGGITGAPQ